MTPPLLALTGVSFGYAGAPVVQDISLSLSRGEVLVLLGPSGCGKTSLLRLMAGLLAPTGGEVRQEDRAPRPGARNAMVFQSYRLLPWKTVAQNVAFALPPLPAAERAERVAAALHLVGLSRVAGHWPAALSGGMKQRVALARALAARPDVLLMDEPFAALDAQTRELMQCGLLRLVAQAGGPGVVFVTHSVDEALLLGHRIAVMSARPGRIMATVTPPRWTGDPHAHPGFAPLRRQLWDLLRDAVLNDPASDFYRPVP
ncbi:ABC transporter ATP-binding protein [Neotabrizicola sp. VNH66]|uniref:ABC transporter ATP-binding protein n=1 Tax=Neotabrizicola sp. VNH66 TaxID=3400918 RepID=UPI003C0E6106